MNNLYPHYIEDLVANRKYKEAFKHASNLLKASYVTIEYQKAQIKELKSNI